MKLRRIALSDLIVLSFCLAAIIFLIWGSSSSLKPFAMSARTLSLLKDLILVALTAAFSLVVFLAPGLVLRQALLQHYKRRLNFIWVPFVGLTGLAVIGLAAWVGPASWKPTLIAKVSLWLLVGCCSWRFLRVPISSYTNLFERRVLLVTLILVAIGVAKASYSLGPPGELFGGTISRTLEVGGRSDSRLPFHVAQLVAWRSKPFSDRARYLYSSYGTWNFSHRGALSAIAATPAVLAAPVRLPITMPDEPWTVFDPEGFSAFRIVMIVMACCSLIAVYGISTLFLSDEWAFLSFLVAATAPFVVHEIYFTWPKLEAGCYVLLAGYVILRRRYFWGGFALGLGYLCHPSALTGGAILAGLIALSPSRSTSRTNTLIGKLAGWTWGTLLMLAGLAIWLIVWRWVNAGHFQQAEFFKYFLWADSEPSNVAQWLKFRLDSIWKTLVPLHTFLFHRTDPDANLTHSPGSVVFCLQYWTTLPFGAGFGYFFYLLRCLWLGWVHARAWLILVFCVPFAFFDMYWGASNSGLMREGLHAWFLALTIFSVCMLKQADAQSPLVWRLVKVALLFRAIELLVMMLLPTLSSQSSIIKERFALTDVIALLTITAGVIGLCWYTFSYAGTLAHEALMKCGSAQDCTTAARCSL